METITWVAISGGVITAEIINTMTKANFLFFLMNAGVTRPILLKKKIIIGSSKIIPPAKTEERTILIKDSMSNWFSTVLEILKLDRKLIDKGTITKYPKRTPKKNKKEATAIKPLELLRSLV